MSDNTKIIADYAFVGCALTNVVLPESLTTIGTNTFSSCLNLTSVYYKGTMTQWTEITTNSNNGLSLATVYYYVEKEQDVPADDGNYWHYDQENNPIAW